MLYSFEQKLTNLLFARLL